MSNKVGVLSKNLIPLCIVVLALIVSCQHNPYPGIPKDSSLLDEAYGIKVFLSIDDTTCKPNKVTLWSYDEKTQEAKRIVSTIGEDVAVWCKSDTIKSIWPKDSISSIYSAKIISWPDAPLRIVVDGCLDQRNVWTYIISEDSDSAILLPTNAGFLGYTAEEDLIIAQSYDYYGFGGRYNVLKVFDSYGNLMHTIPINRKTDVSYELFLAALEFDWYVNIEQLQKLVIDNPTVTTERLIEIAIDKFGGH